MWCCCCCWQQQEQLEPLISDTLVPRLTQMARRHQTLFALHADNARRFAMLGQPGDAAEAEEKATRERRYYTNIVQLKQLLEGSRITLDQSAGVIQYNAEVAALLGEMPSTLQQDLGSEFSLHFTADDATATQ